MEASVLEAHQNGIQDRIATLCGHRNVADAQLVAVIAEAVDTGAWFMGGIKSPEHFVAWQTGSSGSRSHNLVAVARRRFELPAVYAAFQNGELSFDQISTITAHAPAWADEELAEFARNATVSQLRYVMRKYPWPDEDDNAPDPVDTDPPPPTGTVDDDWYDGPDHTWADIDTGPGWNDPFDDEEAVEGPAAEPATDDVSDTDDEPLGESSPSDPLTPPLALPPQPVVGRQPVAHDFLSLTFDENGRFRLVVEGDSVDGALIDQALKEAHDRLFRDKVQNLTWVDALVDVADRSLAGVADDKRADRYRTYLHLDTNNTWLSAGPNLPRAMADLLTCDGTIQPLWMTEGTPVNIGHAQQIVPNHTRRIIYDRDRTCRHPACNGTKQLRIHHIIHWRAHGPSDTWNLLALCPAHHTALHKRQFDIAGNADDPDGLTFTVDGKPFARPAPTPPNGSPPPAPPPGHTYRHPTGERLDLWSVAFTRPRRAA